VDEFHALDIDTLKGAGEVVNPGCVTFDGSGPLGGEVNT
jgi:hypothetical protein